MLYLVLLVCRAWAVPEALRADAGIDPYSVGADSISARGLAAAAGQAFPQA